MPLLPARFAISAIFFAHGFTFGSLAVEFPELKHRLNVGDAEFGRLLLAMAVGAIVAMPFAGHATRRFGNLGAVSAAGLIYSALVACVAAPLGVLGMALLFLVTGMSNGLMDVIMNAEGVLVERRIARPIMSSLHGFWSLSTFAAAGFGWLVLDRLGTTAHLGMACLGALALLVAGVASLNAVAEGPPAHGYGFSLPSRATLALGLITMLGMMSEGALMDWGAIYARDVLKVSTGDASTVLFTFAAGMAGGRFAGDWVRGHWSAEVLTRASGIAAVAGCLVAVATGILPVVAFGFLIAGLGLSNLVPVMFGVGARLPGISAETAVAGIATIGYAGFLMGPPAIGWIAEHFGLGAGLGIVVVFGTIVALSAGAARDRSDQP